MMAQPKSISKALKLYAPFFNGYLFRFKIEYTDKTQNGKSLKLPKGWQKLTAEECKATWSNTGNAIGVITGGKSGVTVLDADIYKDQASKDKWNEWEPLFQGCLMSNTGKNGRHVFFKYDPDFKTQNTLTAEKGQMDLDTRNDGGFIILPPSKYKLPDGTWRKYTWAGDGPSGQLQEVPSEIKNKMTEWGAVDTDEKEEKEDDERSIPPGEETSKLSALLNELTGLNTKWAFVKDYDGGQLMFDRESKNCLCNPNYEHKNMHATKCSLFVGPRNVTAVCMGKGGKKNFKIKDHPIIKDLRAFLKLVNEKDEDPIDTYSFEIFKKAYFAIGDADLSGIIAELLDGQMLVLNQKEKYQLYLFEKGLWKINDNLDPLMDKIEKILGDLFSFVIKSLKAYLVGETVSNEKISSFLNDKAPTREKEIEGKLRELKRFRKMCKDLNTKKVIAKGCSSKFKCPVQGMEKETFINNLDTKPHLFSFGEKVFDLETCEFRDALPSDMCSKKCGVSLDNLNDEYKQDVEELMESIMPDEERRTFLIRCMSDWLYGSNYKEKFYIWMGTGGNGKGVIADLLKATFGDYYAEMPSTVITGQQLTADKPTPALIPIRGSRIVMMSEPDQNNKINNNMMKRLSGDGDLYYRPLFGEATKMDITFTVVLQANNIQYQDVGQGASAMERRTRKITFEQLFKDEGYDGVHIKKANPDLKKKEYQEKIKGSFLNLLLEEWIKLQKLFNSYNHPYLTPESIKEESKEFINEADPVQRFFNQAVERTNNTGDVLVLADLFRNFSEWKREEEVDEKIKKGDFKKRITAIIGKKPTAVEKVKVGGEWRRAHNFWTRYRLINDEEIEITESE
jgi:phage/plasmid-associated DNA primase